MLGASVLFSTSYGSSAKILSLLDGVKGALNEIFENIFAKELRASDYDLRHCRCRISAIWSSFIEWRGDENDPELESRNSFEATSLMTLTRSLGRLHKKVNISCWSKQKSGSNFELSPRLYH